MTDDRIMRPILLVMESDCIKSLLAGNDTCCFTTLDYVHARDKWINDIAGSTRESLGIGPIGKHDMDSARKQLLSVPQLVREVGENVWTYPE